MHIPDAVGLALSIVFMASTIVASAMVVLRVQAPPLWQALLIAAVSNLMGKVLVSYLHWPAHVSYSAPTVAFLILSWWFFKPSPYKLLVYWLVGFAMYLAIHIAISLLLGWTFMFPFWDPREIIR